MAKLQHKQNSSQILNVLKTVTVTSGYCNVRLLFKVNLTANVRLLLKGHTTLT